jgi:hypothetical protein
MSSQLPSISGGRSSTRNPRTLHAVVTGTHLSRNTYSNLNSSDINTHICTFAGFLIADVTNRYICIRMELRLAQLHWFFSCQQDSVKSAMLVLLTVRKYGVMLYSFFWVIPRRLNFMFRRFRTFCSIFIGRVFEDRTDSVPKRWHIKFRRRGITQNEEYNRWNKHSVPKRRYIKFRRRGITQKKAYNKWNRQSVPRCRHKIQTPGITQKREYNRWNRQCSEMSAHKIQTPGNHPKERIQHSQQGESLN